ncbi:hypothetical protein [Chryseobacterium sp.]|uniref:hypothetical protein n=1 Tax=Chryseobacterium sp. TaxID=1871047 RepID=UPI0032197D95
MFKFTTDDFLLLSIGVAEESVTETIQARSDGGNVDETLNNSAQYSFIVHYNNITTIESFEFKKISATEIQWKEKGSIVWSSLIKL